MSLLKSDGTVIAENVELADSYLKKMLGVIFRKSLDGALVFDMGRNAYDGIHMLFVRFPIDVVFLSSDKKIVDLKAGVKPWVGSAFPRSRFWYAIELPAGAVDRFSLKIGEQLVW